jgi:hypothetical protein
MNMSKMKAGFLALPLLGLMAVAINADAAQKLVPGLDCVNYNAAEAIDIDRFQYGVRNINASPRNVVCSLPRELTVNGGTVVVNGANFGGQTTFITAYSHNNFTLQFAAKSVNSAAATYSIPINFTAAELPAANQLTLMVLLPASGNGIYTSTSLDH